MTLNLSAKKLGDLRKQVKRNHFDVYRRWILKLLWVHTAELQEHPDLVKLYKLFRAGDYASAYALTGSIGQQEYANAELHYVHNQFVSLIKKYPWPREHIAFDARAAALKKFLSAEKRCRLINRKHDLLQYCPSRDKFKEEVGLVRKWIADVIGYHPPLKRILENANFGDGATIGASGLFVNALRKLSMDKYSVGPRALHHGFGLIMRNHHFLEEFLELRGGYYCYDLEAAFTKYVSRLTVVSHNKVSFVWKTAETERTIAVEPILNSMLQLGVDHVLKRKLRRVGIDLSFQEPNQEMARLGSLDDGDDSFVTIDLRMASDSLSFVLCERVVPPNWHELLRALRSERYLLPDGTIGTYHKMCSMGNGFCFPLETLIFAAVCAACGCGEPGRDFRVYGDDIIVRKRFSSKVIALLRHFGFRTNSDKTFVEGPFRESCGSDWFQGLDVRPFVLDYAFDKVENIFKCLNLSQDRERWKAFFGCARHILVSGVPEELRFFRPLKGAPDTGIDSTGSEHLTSNHCTFVRTKAWWRWKELSFHPVRDEYGSVEGASHRLMHTLLRGSVSDSQLPKADDKRYWPRMDLRGKTRTRIVTRGYPATSTWLPAVR